MLTGGLVETSGAKIIAAMLVVLLISSILVFGVGGAALAAPDYDGDGATDDDCEPLDPAVHPGATDHPDLAFEDLDCDGIDGDRDGAYFVMPSGNDNNVGTANAPFQTIQKAIDTARTTSTKDLYIATGTYNQRLNLQSDADGIRIYGGYEAGTWDRTTGTTTIVNGQPEAMVLDGAREVVVQLVTLNGTRGAGLSAYGVRAVNGSELALIDAVATAGPGGTGASGLNGSRPGKAANGAPGLSGPADCNIPGDGGWISQPGSGTNGGAGGNGGEETNDGENGTPGSRGEGFGGGVAGAAGVDIAGDSHGPNDGMHGGPGGPGSVGAAGSNGSGGGNDLGNAGATWIGRNGTDGTNGGTGYGGGGGGGGAGRGNVLDWGAGAGGGQGGDGGAGGTRGVGGGWGGGSFGLYLHNSEAAIVDGSRLQSANGGAGGAGGDGGAGGEGGDGGAGGSGRNNCGITVGNGGSGGKGGAGGDGGAGGGGSGGPSAALMRVGTAAAIDHDSTLNHGSGGSGGGTGATGQSGQRLPAASTSPTDFDGDGITDSSDACVEIARGTDANGDGCPDRPARVRDPVAPTVLDDSGSLEPDRGATRVSRATNVSATFSEEMKANSLTSSTFKLQMYNKKKKKWTTIPATIALTNNNATATLDPYGATERTAEKPLAANKKFRGIISTGAKDLAGNQLAKSFVWAFTTGSR